MEVVETDIHACVKQLNEKLTLDKLDGIATSHQIEELRKAEKGTSLDFWVNMDYKGK